MTKTPRKAEQERGGATPPSGLRPATSPSQVDGEDRASTALVCASPRPSRRTSRAAFQAEPPDPDDPLLGFEAYVHKAPRRNSIVPDRQRAFIATLAATGIVTQAARAIGASLEALYRLRNMPGAEGFAAAWELALDRGIARLEDCALERAILGEERMFVRNGEVVARWTVYDTRLLMFLLSHRRARRYAVAGNSFANLKPGHPVYERLKREWAAETEEDTEQILQSINESLEKMRQRSLAAAAPGAQEDGPEEVEDEALSPWR